MSDDADDVCGDVCGEVCGEVCGNMIVVCCCGGDSDSHSKSRTSTVVACLCCLLVLLLLAALLVAAFAFVVPVRVTANDAALGRLALANASGGGTNGTALSYDIAVAVNVHNHNWAMAVWRRGPLDVELRFRGRTFVRARLAGEGRDKIRALRRGDYHLAAAGQSAPVELGPDGAAEFASESAAGVFELELAVFGVHYEAHPGLRAIRVVCPLRLSPSTATGPTAFARVRGV